MSAFKSDFLNVMSERGFIHQMSDEKGLDDLLSKEVLFLDISDLIQQPQVSMRAA